jgi:hypothetical protein
MIWRTLAAVAALSIISGPVSAGSYACLVGATPEMWAQKTGQHPVMTMSVAVGENATTPAVIMVDKDGGFVMLFRAPTGQTCVMAIGKDAVIVPQGDPA